MEPKFINQYQVTLEMYRYWEKHPVGKKAIINRKIGICLRIILICCGLLLVLDGLLIRKYIFLFFGVLAVFLGLTRMFFLPKKILKRQHAMILKSQNADAWVNKFTFSDEIVCKSGNASFRYAYSDIINVTEDSNYFYLFYNEDMVLRIYKPGFAVGTVNDFRKYFDDIIKNRSVEK